jgi:hypothetical protein
MDRRGLFIVAALAGSNAFAALVVNSDKFIGGLNPLSFKLMLFAVALPLLLWAVVQPVKLALQGSRTPLRDLRAIYLANAPLLLNAALVLFLFILNANSVAVFKTAIPETVPFYADTIFARMDRMLFLTDPWKITHQLGPNFTLFLDRLYASWFVAFCAAIVCMALSKDPRKQFIGLLTFTLSWIVLGQLGATLLSSAGPILVGGLLGDPQFDGLVASLKQEPSLFVLAIREHLLTADIGIGSGISAMPSMHVAMAVFWTLLARLYFPRLWWPVAIYAFLTWIASFHLGWHYAVDGLVSFIGVLAIWRLSVRAADALFGEPAGAALPA